MSSEIMPLSYLNIELLGTWYEVVNHQVYDEFKSLGPGWSFIKGFHRTRNGREAILTLKRQCEGTLAIQSRKASAYAKIASARYSGHKKAFTFDSYVEMHQNAHNTLAELNEAVPETKKVTDFLAGITDSRLANAKDLILGDPAKLENFEACQQYLKMLVYNKTTQEKHERQISGLQQGGKSKTAGKDDEVKNKSPGGKRAGGPEGDGAKIVARQYTKAEWSKFTPEQRAKVKELRSNKRRKTPAHRNASAAQIDEPNAPPTADPSTPTHVVAQVATALRGNLAPPTVSRSVRFAERG
jgi:hypothetical protein